jgi:hypothetical protein
MRAKPVAAFLNTARGGLVDGAAQEARQRALDQGTGNVVDFLRGGRLRSVA